MAGPEATQTRTRELARPLIDAWAFRIWFSWRQLWFPETAADAVDETVALPGSAF